MKILVVSLGGSPDPIRKSIENAEPTHVLFFASNESKTIAKSLIMEKETSNASLECKIVLTQNINELEQTFQSARECTTIVNEWTKDQEVHSEVYIDYTGGTKNMSVALALAFLFEGFPFRYVGGEKRTKAGLGQVENGYEKIFASVNPWTFLAIQEKKTMETLINQHEYEQASLISKKLAKQNIAEKEDFSRIATLCEALHSWDLFRYRHACGLFQSTKLTEKTERHGWYQDACFAEFASLVKPLIPRLNTLNERQGKPSLESVYDLIANADRREAQGKYDDGVLRLYRAIEMIGQVELDSYGIQTEDVDIQKVPISLKGEMEQKRKSSDQKIKIGLNDSWKLLYALGNAKAQNFKEQEKNLENISSTRNHSYLAHGFIPIQLETYRKLRVIVFSFASIEESQIAKFPKMIRK